MKKVLQGTDLLNSIYSVQKENFQKCHPSFHNLLWQLIINEAWKKNKRHCFAPVVSNVENAGGFEVGIVETDEQGYFPTRVFFKEGLTFDECVKICEAINTEMFGLSPTNTNEIITSSMRYIAAG